MDWAGVSKVVEEYQHVIWDWNGTLLDDVVCAHLAISELLANHGKPPITVEEYRTRFRFPVVDYYKDLGFDFTHRTYDELSREWTASYRSHQDRMGLFPGIAELLARLQGLGISSHILTAAHEADVEQLTRHYGIRSLLASIHGLDNHHATSKLARGRQMMDQLGVPKERAILVGDTDHDAEVALELGIDAVLLDEGHQSGRDHDDLRKSFGARGKRLWRHSRRGQAHP